MRSILTFLVVFSAASGIGYWQDYTVAGIIVGVVAGFFLALLVHNTTGGSDKSVGEYLREPEGD